MYCMFKKLLALSFFSSSFGGQWLGDFFPFHTCFPFSFFSVFFPVTRDKVSICT